MDKTTETLTNEKLLKQFKSQFELVNYAIKLAENMIKTGRDSRVRTTTQNRALQIVVEIEEGKDQFDEIVIEVPLVDEEVKQVNQYEKEEHTPRKSPERRKLKELRAK